MNLAYDGKNEIGVQRQFSRNFPPTPIFHSALLVILLKLPYQILSQSNMFGETILTIRNNVLGPK